MYANVDADPFIAFHAAHNPERANPAHSLRMRIALLLNRWATLTNRIYVEAPLTNM